MLHTSTITQKGQVVIPKEIRDIFGLKPYQRVKFVIENQQIVVKPLVSIDEAFGMFAYKKKITEKTDKEVIIESVLKKSPKKR